MIGSYRRYRKKNDRKIIKRCKIQKKVLSSPSITVVITAYNRREFILQSIKCALNQTLEREKYEIIVIKNFSDDAIDKFIEQNQIISIIAEGIEGEYPNIAIRYANSDILSFLDDDDLMSKNKLHSIYEIFKDSKIGYYHNNFNVISGRKIIRNRLINSPRYKTIRVSNKKKRKYLYYLERKSLYINNSCISIRKDVLKKYIDFLKVQNANIDRFLYVSALLSDYDMYFDNKIYNSYRIHNNQTSAMVSNDFITLQERKLRFISKSINASENIFKLAIGTKFEHYCASRLMNLKLAYNFWSFKKKYKFKLKAYIQYLLEGDLFEIPLLFIYNTPKFVRPSVIRIIYKL